MPASASLGIQTIRPRASIVIPVGLLVRAKTNGSPSGSFAETSYRYATPAGVICEGTEVIAGGRFVAETVTMNDWVPMDPPGSFAEKAISCCPTCPVVGTH